jgi:glycosyltransferase involved in cell wall biosynthesis
MTRSPSIALLIPAYNAESCLGNLIASATTQGNAFDEIWVYDDCSTDHTGEVARALGANVVRGDFNVGCSSGKSVLAQSTKCDWLHFHDADDLILPGMTSAARKWMLERDVDVVVFGCEERWAHNNEYIGVATPDDDAIRTDPVGYTIQYKINAQSGFYRREAFLAVGGFDLSPDVLYNEDQALHCKLAQAGLRFRADPEVYSLYFKNRVSMSNSNQAKCVQAHFAVMKKALAHSQRPQHIALIAERLWQVAAGAAAHLDWETADAAALLAMRIHGPSSAPASKIFKTICALSPRWALRAREASIRCFRPQNRLDFPGWSIFSTSNDAATTK